MAHAALGTFLRYLRRRIETPTELTDRHLLRRYVAGREEAAFEALLHRHAALVWGVCRRLLNDEHDVEDAFQAAFLVLVRKAGSLRVHESLANWLHAVAYRIALKTRVTATRRRRREAQAQPSRPSDPLAAIEGRDLRSVLDEELDRLPERYRAPLVLCYLEGKTCAEAARQLGCKDGTVCGRLARARELLRRRLVRRGLTLSGVILVEPMATPAASLAAVLRMAALFVLGESAAGTVPTSVATLAQGIVRTMAVGKLKAVVAVLLAVGVFAAGAGWAAHQVLAPKPADTKQVEEEKAAAKPDAVKQGRTDYYDDPLPPGAVARMGSVQLRHEGAHLAFSADGKTLISAGWDATVRFWDMATGRQVRQTRIRLPKSPPSQPWDSVGGLSPNGKVLAVFEGEALDLYDTTTGEKVRRFPAEGVGYKSLSFSADGNLLATLIGVADKYAPLLWDLSTGKERLRLDKLSYTGNTLLLSPDGSRLAYATEKVLHVFDSATGRELGKDPVEGWCFVFSPDSKMLAAAMNYNNETKVTLWETAGLKKRATLRPSLGVTRRIIETPCLTFSPDGKLLALGGLEALVLWDVSTGKERLRLDDRKAKELLFSPDGQTLACAGQFEIRLWNIGTGERLHARPGHDAHVNSVAVSPDGRVVASVAWTDSVVRLWDAATGKPLDLSPQHDSWVRSIAFAADGRLLVADGFGVVRLLDAKTARNCVASSSQTSRLGGPIRKCLSVIFPRTASVWRWSARIRSRLS